MRTCILCFLCARSRVVFFWFRCVCRVHFEWIRCLLSRELVCVRVRSREPAALFNARLIDKQNRYRRPISPNEIHGYCARTLLKYRIFMIYNRAHGTERHKNTYSSSSTESWFLCACMWGIVWPHQISSRMTGGALMLCKSAFLLPLRWHYLISIGGQITKGGARWNNEKKYKTPLCSTAAIVKWKFVRLVWCVLFLYYIYVLREHTPFSLTLFRSLSLFLFSWHCT